MNFLYAEKSFSLSVGFIWAEKTAFSARQKFSIYRKLYALPSKASRFLNLNTACSNNFLLSAKTAFSRTKTFLLHKPFLAGFKKRPFSQTKSLAFTQTFSYSHPKHSFFARCPFQPPLTYCPQKFPIFTNQKPFIRTNLSLLPSKATLFHPQPPIRTTLNLLFAKNTAVLFISALTPCAVKPESRTDSNHCRRYPAKLQLFTKPVT